MDYPDEMLPRLRYRYCPMCRAELSRKVINDDAIERVYCSSCMWTHYPTNVTGVVVLITTQSGIVALLPSTAPEQFPAALPGGHVEYGESPEEAAVREAFEETGLHVKVTRLLGWEFVKNRNYPGPMNQFYFEAEAIAGKLRDSEEGRVKVYRLDDFPPIPPERGGSRKTLQLYKANRFPV